jgi:hypothetical protein
MFSKLLQLDTDVVTPARAAAVFQAEVSRLIHEHGLSLSDAWQQVKSCEPDLYNRISAKSTAPAPAPLANNASFGDLSGVVPAAKQFYLLMMKLPNDTTDAEFARAWKANGFKAAPLNAQDVLAALIGFEASRSNVSIAIARRTVIEKFSTLAAAAGETAVK